MRVEREKENTVVVEVANFLDNCLHEENVKPIKLFLFSPFV